MNVIFKITRENSEFEAECVTDSDGEIYLDHLESGTYHIQETKATPGYARKDEVVDFVVDEFGKINGNSTEIITIENTPVKILGATALDSITKLHEAFANTRKRP